MANTKEQREIEIILNGQKVNSSLKEMGASAALMNNQLKKMAADDPGREKLKSDFHAMRDRINNMRQELYGVEKASLAVKLGLNDMGGLMKTVLGTAGGFLLGGGIQGALSSVKDFFSGANKEAKEFKASLSNLSAITGATGSDLKFYEEQAKLIGQTTSLSAKQAVEAFKLIGSAKPELLKNKEALAGVTQEAIALAEASGMELPEAANSLASSLNQFGAGAEEAGRFINVLAAGAKEGSSEITETAAALKNAGTVAAGANVSFEETNAAIQSLAEISIKGGEAGTGLRNVLLTLQSGADDTNPAIVGLEKALENLGEKNLSTAELAKLFGKENVVVANQLVNSREKIKELTEAMTGTSVAYQQAATNMNNYEGDLKGMESAIESFKIMIGSFTTEAFRPFVRGITDALNWITNLASGTDVSTNSFKDQHEVVNRLETDTVPLIERYEELQSKGELNTTEQNELNTIIEKLAETVPTAVTQFDEYGKALGISAEKAKEFVEQQKAILLVKNKEAIDEQTESLKKINEQISRYTMLLNDGKRVVYERDGMATFRREIALTGDEIQKYRARLAELQTQKLGTQGLIDELKGIKPELKKEAEDTGKETAEVIKVNFEDTLKGLSIQELKDLLENETDATHKKLIRKRIDYLKELEREQKVHDDKLKRAREEYNKAVEDHELELAKLKVEVMQDGIDKVLAKLKLQHDLELKEMDKQKEAVLSNIAATEQEKNDLLDNLEEQRRLKQEQYEEETKLAKETEKAEKAEKDKEDYFTQLESEEEYQMLAQEEQFLRTYDAEAARQMALQELHRQTLEQKLAYLQLAGQGETAEALRIKNELIKIEKDKVDKSSALARERAEFEQKMGELRLQSVTEVFDGVMSFMDKESKAYEIFKHLRKVLTLADIAVNLQKELSLNAVNAAANPLNAVTAGAAGITQLKIANTMSIIRAGLSTAKVIAFEKGGFTNTIPMTEINGAWQMVSGRSGGSIGAFAEGGWVNNAQLGLIGERGRELVLPNWMVESPKYANIVGWLEQERQKGIKAYADGGSTGLPVAVPAPGNESRPLSDFEKQLLQEVRDMRNDVMSWPTKLQVHNSIADTRDQLKVLNDLENKAFA